MINRRPVSFLWTSQMFIEYVHFIALLVCSKACPFWIFRFKLLSAICFSLLRSEFRIYSASLRSLKQMGRLLKTKRLMTKYRNIFWKMSCSISLQAGVYKLQGVIIGFHWVWMNPFEVFTAFSAQCLTYYCYSKWNNGLNFTCSWIRDLLFIIFTVRLRNVNFSVKTAKNFKYEMEII